MKKKVLYRKLKLRANLEVAILVRKISIKGIKKGKNTKVVATCQISKIVNVLMPMYYNTKKKI